MTRTRVTLAALFVVALVWSLSSGSQSAVLAQGRGGPLFTVAHDSTLVGDGTTSSPLGLTAVAAGGGAWTSFFDARPLGGDLSASKFLLPDIAEEKGTPTGTPAGSDTMLAVMNGSSIGGIFGTPDSTAVADLFLFDDAGGLMTGLTGNVCDPCTFNLAPGQKVMIVIEDLINAAGGFAVGETVKHGYGVLGFGGLGVDAVGVQGILKGPR